MKNIFKRLWYSMKRDEPFEIDYRLKKPRPKDPVLIVGLAGGGNVGYKAAMHLKKELKAKKFADIYSMYFYGIEGVEGVAELFKDEISYYNGPKQDLFIVTGLYKTFTPESSWKFAKKLLGFCKEYGIKKVFALGEFQIADLAKEPKVYCQVTDKQLLEKYGVEAHPQETQTPGVEALLIGLGKREGMEGLYFAGESCGVVIVQDNFGSKYYLDSRSAAPLLKKLSDILDVKLDLTDLNKDAEKIDKVLKQSLIPPQICVPESDGRNVLAT